MAAIATAVLNRRELGSTLAAWNYEPDRHCFVAEFRLDAVRYGPGPLATVGLLATSHVEKLSAADKQANDQAQNDFVRDVITTAVNWLKTPLQTWLKLQSVNVGAAAKRLPIGFQDLPASDAMIAYLASESVREHVNVGSPVEAIAKAALTTVAAANDTNPTKGAVWRPMARLAHANIDVDPDNVPRYEREIHHNDLHGKFMELGELLRLVAEALGAATGSELWEALSAGRASASAMFENAASKTVPFGPLDPSSAAIAVMCERVRKRIVADCTTNEPLVLTADFNQEVAPLAPTVHFDENKGEYAVGCATYTFAEALVVAANAIEVAVNSVYTLEDEAEFGPEVGNVSDDDVAPVSTASKSLIALAEKIKREKRQGNNLADAEAEFERICPASGSKGLDIEERVKTSLATYHMRRVGISAVGKALVRGFRGWHHARCLEPRQTAHATIAGRERDRLLKHFRISGPHPAFKKGLMHTTLAMLIDIDTPKLAQHPMVYVRGPGTTAVSTPCSIEQLLMQTHHLKTLETELDRQVINTVADMGRMVDTQTIAFNVHHHGIRGGIKALLLLGGHPDVIARVVRELHTFSNVRHDAGKRYRHAVGVNASFSALTDALKQLVRSQVDVEIATQAKIEFGDLK